MAKNRPAGTRHRTRTSPTLGQGATRPPGSLAVDATSLVVPASVEDDEMPGIEGVATAQSEATEAETLSGLLAVGPLTKSDASVLEAEEKVQSSSQRFLQGRLEKSNGAAIEGWAWDPQMPAKRIRLELVEGDHQLLLIVADIYRYDLIQLGCGDGGHGFRIELEEGLLSEGSHLLFLRCADTGARLPGPPIVAECRIPAPANLINTSKTAKIETGLIIRGQIDEVTDIGILGWVTMPEDPPYKCTVLLKEREETLAHAIASQFRIDLMSGGVADGCCAFVLEPPAALADGQVHMLDVVEKDSCAKLNKEPIRWFRELNAPIKKARPSDALGDKLWSNVRKSDAGRRLRHISSRSDHARYRQMERFATKGATASVLSVTDSIRATGTLPSRFITDSMIAAWLLRNDLRQRFQQLGDEHCQYAFLLWFLCVRPLEEGLVHSWEPTAPILTAMSKVIVAEDAEVGVGCSALMLAAYCYVASYQGSGMLPSLQCQAKDIVDWFFWEGAYHLRVSHAIPQDVRADLAVCQANRTSKLFEWAEQRISSVHVPDLPGVSGSQRILTQLAHSYPQKAASWRDLFRESLIAEDQVQFDDPPDATLPAVCKRLQDAMLDMSELLLGDGEPEYMCSGGNGERLLLKSEWYPAEPAFVWSRAPISTILFCIAGGPVEWARIGLIFDLSPLPERGMKVILNHNTLWLGTIGDASSGELILACTGRCLAHDAPNLLQIEVDSAFVPSEQMPSSDNRRLGVGLKRFWIQRAEGLSE